MLVSPRHLELHRELWARQQAALRRVQLEVVQQAAAAKQVSCSARRRLRSRISSGKLCLRATSSREQARCAAHCAHAVGGAAGHAGSGVRLHAVRIQQSATKAEQLLTQALLGLLNDRELQVLTQAYAQAAQQGVQDLAAQPSWVHGGALYPHQLEAANWLRRLWAEGRPALLADGGGLGKTASVVTFLQSLRSVLLTHLVQA